MRDEDETKEQLIADAKPRQSLARGEMMKDQRKTKEQLVKELAELRQRIAELGASETERKGAREVRDER